MPTNRFVVTAVAIAMLLVGLLSAVSATPTLAQDATPTATPMSAVDVVSQVGPAVVTVINEQTAQGVSTGSSDANGTLQPVGSGTGFIIDDQGHIVTNWHVVTEGEQFQVILSTGETRDATLVGSDPVSDLAVVQITGDIPAIVTFGDSDLLQPGQPVLAIGSPLGTFSNTVTEGIVSAIGRDFQASADQTYTNLIQHDAAINPGNSGGPLFNLNGEVVGVNTLGIPSEQGQPVQGLFFAIPSNTVQQITGQLISDGSVSYPFMGVSVAPVTPDVAAQANLSVDYGAYVADVQADGPSATAGIQADDVILAIDGQRIDQTNSFTEVLFAYQPGDTVEVTILRGGEQQTVEVTLGERPAGT